VLYAYFMHFKLNYVIRDAHTAVSARQSKYYHTVYILLKFKLQCCIQYFAITSDNVCVADRNSDAGHIIFAGV